jgi:hypothetical protein
VWSLTLPEIRMFLVDDENLSPRRLPHQEPGQMSVPDGLAKLNASRKARGLPPLEIKILGGKTQ